MNKLFITNIDDLNVCIKKDTILRHCGNRSVLIMLYICNYKIFLQKLPYLIMVIQNIFIRISIFIYNTN